MSSGEEIKPAFRIVDNNACKEMQIALMAIANEINKLNESSNLTDNDGNIKYRECVLNKLTQCKSRLISKKKFILKLKEDIRVACSKTLMTAKINEITSLKVNINRAQNKIEDLNENDKNQSKIINTLTKENKIVCDELQNLKKFIDSGYKQLQTYQDIPTEEYLPSIVKLKNIIVHYSRNDAEFNNIHQKYEQVLQKNRFLNNKLSIVSQNLNASTNELWNLRNRMLRLKKENSMLKNKTIIEQGKSNNIDFIGYFKTRQKENIMLVNAKTEFDTDVCHIDLKSHLNLVKKLLNDQNEILKELTWLSQGYFNIDSY
ncbi:hypothetical protein K1T71_005033 [Dendrolimus kikuchii]|uniref:Uncharacterized protein n=1 Tax=Dendrolimus kikuchii TaxID=765133 RepID=A0ACC1D628_9NEOP|nr:hypothetical protein K1T71_005033 [Dendrolimus kikuchii]